ncbi:MULTISPECIES: effector-associated constant component EACC1 [Frankia]|uniref:Uncharacterized protein n=1 Tax=Frankia alni (strain DSM 45986 / CECT 9034 / ACN14a) TaxID=326424 RepID=Q0RQZ1_FRAAA|nr:MULTISPECIES: hypothetical protein [Frankia]CAJ60032.1 hypothetical protein FRAAL1372 [Frankia alni ACN14a]
MATAARVRTAGSVLITWLKGRRGDVQATVTTAQGASVSLSASLSATNVRSLTSAEVSALLDKLGVVATGESEQTGEGEGSGPPAEPDGSSQAAG